MKEKNEAWIELSQVKGELIQTNQQLLEVFEYLLNSLHILNSGYQSKGEAWSAVGELANRHAKYS